MDGAGLERLHGAPDGFAFDAHGNLWTTLIGQDRLVAITPEGDVRTLGEDGDRAAKDAVLTSPQDSGAGTALGAKAGDGLAPRMASITFGGPDLQTVYIGSLGGTAADLPLTRAWCSPATLVGRLLTEPAVGVSHVAVWRPV